MDSYYYVLNLLSEMIYKSKVEIPRILINDIFIISDKTNTPIKVKELDSKYYEFFKTLKGE